MSFSDLARKVAARYAFKYQPKETKQHKVERLTKVIRDLTGLGRGTAEDIADAVVRNRDLKALALQKGWPVSEQGALEGPKGSVALKDLAHELE